MLVSNSGIRKAKRVGNYQKFSTMKKMTLSDLKKGKLSQKVIGNSSSIKGGLMAASEEYCHPTKCTADDPNGTRGYGKL